MGHSSLAQIRSYEAATIANYYRFRPWKVIWRAFEIIWFFAGFLLAFAVDRWRSHNGTNFVSLHQEKLAIQLRQILTHLGPTFIKVGQALSTRPDLVQKNFLDELIKLQDQLPPFSNEIAYEIIRQELDCEVDEAFAEISDTPVAAASLGQVYRGRLKSGEEVAIKVQRPNLLPKLTLDLYLMRWAASWLAPFLPLNLGHDLTLIVDEFGTKLLEEINYLKEGQSAEKFAAYFQGNPQVKVPAIYWRYTTSKVLTLEWIHGFKLTDTDRIQAAGLDVNGLIQIGVVSGLKQLLEYGFFHADPHPGNLFATPDGRMAFIDFGMMDQLDETTKETLVDAVVHLINKDYGDLAADFIKLGFLAPGTDIRPIIPALESVLGQAMGERVRDFNFKTITDQFSGLMYDYPFRIPAKFALIIRSLVTQEGLALSLNPNFRIVEVSYPYVARRLLTGESPQLRRRLLEVLFLNGSFQWQRLENLIQIARTDRSFDIFPTAQLGLQYLLSEEAADFRRQLLLALVEDDRLHTREVQNLWNLIKEDIQPARLFNAAWGALAGAAR